jgi:hypothetical protein
MSQQLVDIGRAVRRAQLRALGMTAYGLVALIGGLLFGPRGGEGILESDSLTPFWMFLTAMVVVVGIAVVVVVPISRKERRFRRGLQRFLARERPHAPIILGPQPHDLLGRATAAGVSTDRVGRGGYVGLAVRQEGVEVWVPGDLRPRWRVRRVPGWVRVEPSALPQVGWQKQSPGLALHAIVVADGEQSASVVVQPEKAGRPKNLGRATVEAFAEALHALGEDPAEHLVMPPTGTPGAADHR